MEKQIIHEKQDLTYLNWAKVRDSSGTAGSFLKAYSDLGKEKIYYKLSNYDAFRGIIGHECVNEIIADRLLTILGVEHLHYQLIHADILVDGAPITTWLCSSGDYKKRGESKIALDVYYQAERMDGENPLQFCIRSGWDEYIYTMLVVDFLILNRDRHGANIEVLRNQRTRTVRLAPLFDHGLSLLFGCTDIDSLEKADIIDSLEKADIMEDKPVQCFVGSRSAQENLKLIPKGKLPRLSRLAEKDRSTLMDGLDEVLPNPWREKVWAMIWERWRAYEDFCNQG